MPYRQLPLVDDEIYHIYNRSFNQQTIFLDKSYYARAISSLNLYRHLINIKYAFFKTHLPKTQKKIIEEKIPLIEIIAYCFMPNHFHLLVKQIHEQGIVKAVGKFSTSYAKYFNTRRNKKGPVFEGRFKAVLIESNEQLLHVSRYIHLNPYSSSLIKMNGIKDYPYSSIGDYLGNSKDQISDPSIVLRQFKSRKSYFNFVTDNADYQQYLQRIKKQLIDGDE